MANYKLKYSGEKIDELLTKIDNLGTGTDENSGTVKLSSATNSDSGVSDGVAATPAEASEVSFMASDRVTLPAVSPVAVPTSVIPSAFVRISSIFSPEYFKL